MQIEKIELLELFMKTVCEADVSQPHLVAISTSSTLLQQLDGCPTLMQRMADRYEQLGEKGLAQLTWQLEEALLDDNLLQSHKPEKRVRLLEYVYPVV